MYMQLSNKGCTIKQHIQQKTGNGLLQLWISEACFI